VHVAGRQERHQSLHGVVKMSGERVFNEQGGELEHRHEKTLKLEQKKKKIMIQTHRVSLDYKTV